MILDKYLIQDGRSFRVVLLMKGGIIVDDEDFLRKLVNFNFSLERVIQNYSVIYLKFEKKGDGSFRIWDYSINYFGSESDAKSFYEKSIKKIVREEALYFFGSDELKEIYEYKLNDERD